MRSNLSDHLARNYQGCQNELENIVLVLGVDNVLSIPVTDAFTQMFQEVTSL